MAVAALEPCLEEKMTGELGKDEWGEKGKGNRKAKVGAA